jgi:hypothetical protein
MCSGTWSSFGGGYLATNWKVLHVDGHVENRKKDRKTWTFEEIGNDKSDPDSRKVHASCRTGWTG